MTLSSEKYLTDIVVIIVYIEEVGALIAKLCNAWSNCPKKAGINCFHKELHVATATIIISYANDVAGVWDQVLQHNRHPFVKHYYMTSDDHLLKTINNRYTLIYV